MVYTCGATGPGEGEGAEMPAAAVEAATVSASSAFSAGRLLSMEMVRAGTPGRSAGAGAAASDEGAVFAGTPVVFL
jgi:hypothetical protein